MLLPTRRQAEVPQKAEQRPNALTASSASLFLPGGGQLWQRRYGAATIHLLTCAGFIIAATRFGGGWWTVGALAVNVWSSIEAAWWARGSGEDDGDVNDNFNDNVNVNG